jgi:hypothetical protein
LNKNKLKIEKTQIQSFLLFLLRCSARARNGKRPGGRSGRQRKSDTTTSTSSAGNGPLPFHKFAKTLEEKTSPFFHFCSSVFIFFLTLLFYSVANKSVGGIGCFFPGFFARNIQQ